MSKSHTPTEPVCFWKDDNLFVRCPHCQNVQAGGAWLAAHNMYRDIVGTCEKCRKQFNLGVIPAPKKKGKK